MTAFVSQKAPDFSAEAYVNGEFKKVSLSDYRGKKLVLFFYPLDFTFVCPTEILAFADRLAEFKKRDTEVIGVSVDSKFTHKAWADTERADGGIKGVNFPLVSDINKTIARDYGVLLEDAQEISRLNGNVLSDVADEEDTSVPRLGNAQERGAHFDRLEARFVDDDHGTGEVRAVRMVCEEVVNGCRVGEAVTP